METVTTEIEPTVCDEALMQQLAERNGTALRELSNRYIPILRKVILGIIHDEAEADDVLQETLLQLWERASDYSADNGKPLGWMITMARRRAIDRLRKLQAYRRATDRFEVYCVQPDFGLNRQPERDIVRDDLRHMLDEMLNRLPPQQQAAIKMAFYDGMSQREIAAHTSIPLGTIKTRIELGLRKLSGALQQMDGKV